MALLDTSTVLFFFLTIGACHAQLQNEILLTNNSIIRDGKQLPSGLFARLSTSTNPKPLSTRFPINKKVFDTSGKNVMGMMEKIEELLKEGVKPAKPSSSPETQDRRWPSKASSRLPANSGHSKPVQRGEQPHPSTILDSIQGLEFLVKEHAKRDNQYRTYSVHDYKRIWINMLDAVFHILENEDLIEESGNGKTLEKIFHLLQSINLIDYRHRKDQEKCPFTYDKAGDLCLSAEEIEHPLSWEDARTYCKVVKGGDLVVFRDACDFAETLKYLRKIDPEKECSYWFGGTDLDQEGVWKYLDGTVVHFGAPFWGSTLGEIEPSDGDIGQDYGILLNTDNFYMHDVNNDLAVKSLNVKPLCQYIPDRDGYVHHSKKPSGWGPYASYDDWKKYEHIDFYGSTSYGANYADSEHGGSDGGDSHHGGSDQQPSPGHSLTGILSALEQGGGRAQERSGMFPNLW